MQAFEFSVKGMDCAECAAHVEKALSELPRVDSAQVLLGAEKAIIQYSDDPPQQADISQAVVGAGYEAVFEPIKETAGRNGTINQFSIRFFILIVILVLGISIAGETLGIFDTIQVFIPWYVWLALILLGGWPIFRNVLQSLLKKRIISHTLMSASVITAAALGEWVTAVLIVFFMRFGDLIERKTTDSARQSIRKLGNLVPKTARVLVEGEEKEIAISGLNPGDAIVVHPGESIPADGIVVDGHASVDQSSITGESIPIELDAGKRVSAASILTTGMLVIKVTAVGRETTFGKIIQMVEEAEAARGKVQRYADRFSGFYLPIVALIALITFLIRRDLTAAASVMVVACSCSFSLATPVAMLASIGASAQNGLLFKGGKYVEMLSSVDTVFIDKTGTLTIGQPVITDIIPTMEITERDLLQYCASAERYSDHPLAEAVLRKAIAVGVPLLPVKDFNNIPGKGVSAEIKGRKVLVENSPVHHTADYSNTHIHLQEEGKTLLFVHIDGEDAGILAAEDVLREDAALAIGALRKIGIKHLKLISGDHQKIRSQTLRSANPTDILKQ